MPFSGSHIYCRLNALFGGGDGCKRGTVSKCCGRNGTKLIVDVAPITTPATLLQGVGIWVSGERVKETNHLFTNVVG